MLLPNACVSFELKTAGCGKEKIKSNSCRMWCRDYISVDLYHKSGDSDVWNVHGILMPVADSRPSIQLHERRTLCNHEANNSKEGLTIIIWMLISYYIIQELTI